MISVLTSTDEVLRLNLERIKRKLSEVKGEIKETELQTKGKVER